MIVDAGDWVNLSYTAVFSLILTLITEDVEKYKENLNHLLCQKLTNRQSWDSDTGPVVIRACEVCHQSGAASSPSERVDKV